MNRFFALSLLSLAFLGCKGEQAPSAPQTNAATTGVAEKAAEPVKITVYSGRSEALVAPLFEAYEKATGVDLEIRYADSSQLAATLLEEGAKSPADVFFSQDTTTLGLLEGKGMFGRLSDETLNLVDARFRSAKGEWIGTSGRARVLVWHTGGDLKQESLPSLEDLTKPEWKGKVGWAPENASFKSFVAAMVAMEGAEKTAAWVKAMQDNEPKAYPSNTPLVTAVGKGEIQVGLTNHYYLHRLKAEHGEGFAASNHYYKNGKAESLMNLSGAAVLKTSKHTAEAEAFIVWLLSSEAQKQLSESNYEFPVIPNVATAQGLPGVDSVEPPKIDYGVLDDLKTVETLLRDSGALL